MKLPPGFTSRPATLGDLDGVAALVTEWELTYTGESEAARAMLQYEWGAASFDMERDTRVIHAADGALAAFAQHSTPDPELLRYHAFGPVDPSFEGRGLGSSIVEWTETETRSRIGQGSTARLWNSVQAGNDGRDRAARDARLRSHQNLLGDDHGSGRLVRSRCARPRA